jgi:hypothetical protein
VLEMKAKPINPKNQSKSNHSASSKKQKKSNGPHKVKFQFDPDVELNDSTRINGTNNENGRFQFN